MTARNVLPDGSEMRIRTNRIGLLSIHASAPVLGGTVSDAELEFTVRIDAVATGNPLLDPELHALIHQLTSGTLTYQGQRTGDIYSGHAQAGSIVVPLDLTATGQTTLELRGRSQFQDLQVPLPGMGHIRHLTVDIDGHIHLG